MTEEEKDLTTSFGIPVADNQSDGAMRFDDNGGASVNYEPNSFGGPTEMPEYKEPAFEVSGVADRIPFKRDDDFFQAGELYRIMNADQKARLVSNIVGSMKPVKPEIQLRQIAHFYKADPNYGTGVARGLGIDIREVAIG